MKKEEGFLTNLNKFYVMTLLVRRSMHGYDIIEQLGKYTGKKPSAGQIYPLLKKLEKKGYITSKKIKSAKKKRVYVMTAEGRKFCKSMFHRFSEILDTAFESSLIKCRNCGCRIYKGGHIEIINSKKMAFCCKYCAASYIRTFRN